ncbi:metalloregulator ArsR/SmtB family transcription factor [uncultured Marinococcus sp.]|jgi:DNA-binding transcriptional ArsR family regulator|uniref:ArsR/SmtB family transcription factor n=1 Tax=uncultured Marinococcus sp. TaxID=487012 RepID=UPI00261F0A96|nr:metalloregulator ArsR/SmtB family transcription factor [uncultured Marinococcus sp.]
MPNEDKEAQANVDWIQQQIQERSLDIMTDMLKGLADGKRMQIAQALALTPELSVHSIAEIIDSSIATASHHLRYMHKLGLTKFRKEGRTVYYSLDDEHVRQVVELVVSHQAEIKERQGKEA